jgi:hypothetical protein
MGMAEQSRVELPDYVQGRLEVYLNGVPQQPGGDYRQVGRTLVFDRPLEEEGKLGFWRWLSLALGIAGTYRKDDKVDVIYDAPSGRRDVATGLRFSRAE